MQIIHQTTLTADEYIYEQTWKEARLTCCPNPKKTNCRLHRHGSYPRKTPRDIRIARYYCRTCEMTFGLVPSFMAVGIPGTLQEVEEAVLAVEERPTLTSAHDRIRPDHNSSRRAQHRWLQKRVLLVNLILHTVKGLFSDL